MKARICTFVVLLAVTLTISAQQKKVAVYVTGEDSGVNKVLGDQLVAGFARSGKYIAVERTASFLAELGKEQSYQRTGAISDNQIAALGVQFGVNYVCVADVSEVFGEKYISARLIDVETAEIVNTHNVSGELNSMSKCLEMANTLTENLTKGTFAEQAAEQSRKRLEELKAQGYIDLGLPSGTLWKDKNESGYYNYNQAMNQFGKRLPTKEQLEELITDCHWTWDGGGFKVTGPNGESIYLPADGICFIVKSSLSGQEKRHVERKGDSGTYWSSDCYQLSFYREMTKAQVYSGVERNGRSVRLVKYP